MVLTLAYNSINHYLLPCQGGYLLLDPGWPGSLARLQGELTRQGLALSAVKWVAFTHAHPDHAGLAEEVKRAAGARLLIHELQVPHLPALAQIYARKGGYVPIAVAPSDLIVRAATSRRQLHAIGLDGDLIPTPGHSEDSVTMLLATGEAFTGDLPLPEHVDEESAEVVGASWDRLWAAGMKRVLPEHGTMAGLTQER